MSLLKGTDKPILVCIEQLVNARCAHHDEFTELLKGDFIGTEWIAPRQMGDEGDVGPMRPVITVFKARKLSNVYVAVISYREMNGMMGDAARGFLLQHLELRNELVNEVCVEVGAEAVVYNAAAMTPVMANMSREGVAVASALFHSCCGPTTVREIVLFVTKPEDLTVMNRSLAEMKDVSKKVIGKWKVGTTTVFAVNCLINEVDRASRNYADLVGQVGGTRKDQCGLYVRVTSHDVTVYPMEACEEWWSARASCVLTKEQTSESGRDYLAPAALTMIGLPVMCEGKVPA